MHSNHGFGPPLDEAQQAAHSSSAAPRTGRSTHAAASPSTAARRHTPTHLLSLRAGAADLLPRLAQLRLATRLGRRCRLGAAAAHLLVGCGGMLDGVRGLRLLGNRRCSPAELTLAILRRDGMD